MQVHIFAFQKRLVRVEGTRAAVDLALEDIEVGDELYDIREKFTQNGCEVEFYP